MSSNSHTLDSTDALANRYSADRPFLIQLRHDEDTPNGSFRPAASLLLRESLRTSGLLFLLAPEDVKSLLFLLTFLSPNGECQAPLPLLAGAMRVSVFKTQRRMRRLTAFVWNNEPLVFERKWESGLIVYRPHPHLLAYESLHAEGLTTAPAAAGSRDRVIAHSRQTYGRPREEVEREMARQMGWDKEQRELEEKTAALEQEIQSLTPHARDVLQRLESISLTSEQALELLRTYDTLRIERQLQWLPYRHAKNPAGFLMAAVADNYEAPPTLRHGTPSQRIPVPEPDSKPLIEEVKLTMPPMTAESLSPVHESAEVLVQDEPAAEGPATDRNEVE